jgi:signal transduction histidine kinase
VKRIYLFLLGPTPDEQDRKRLTELLPIVLLAALAITVLAIFAFLVTSSTPAFGLFGAGFFILPYLGVFLLLKSGRLRLASLVVTTVLWSTVTLVTFTLAGVQPLSYSGYVIVMLIANLLLGEQAGLLFLVLSLLSGGLAMLVDFNQIQHFAKLPDLPVFTQASQAAVFIATALLTHLAFKNLRAAVTRARMDERHLERRAVQIQVAAEVARDATATREMDTLLNRAVSLIRDRFGFYHAGIFLNDEKGEWAILRAASGEAGQEMLLKEHRLKVGEMGIVGYVAGSGQPRIALDVGRDAVHFKNPWLPDTRSEMALPLQLGSKVIGVLDVQSNLEAAFDSEDIAILQTMADQLAVAFETARLFDATRRQLEELIVLQAVAAAGAEACDEDMLIERATTIIGGKLFPDNFGIILLDDASRRLLAHRSYRERLDIRQTPIPLGSGVSGMVACDGKPRRIEDVSLYPGYLAIDPQTCSEVCVPLRVGERIIGVINAESTRVNAFTEEDERLLLTLAGQMSTAIEKLRLIDAERSRRKEAEMLRDAITTLTSTLDLKQVLDHLLNLLKVAVPYDSACVFLVNGDYLHPMANRDLPDRSILQTGKFPIADALFQEIVSAGRPLIIEDIQLSPNFHGWGGTGYVHGWMGIPLITRGQIIGCLTLDNRRIGAYGEREASLAQAFANQAAVALENARLFGETQYHARDLASALNQLRELDRLKSEFIQNVSHELRTPLAIIRGYAELLDGGELGDLQPIQREPMNIITRRVHTLNKMVDDLLAILETEGHTLVREPVDLGQMISNLLVDFHKAFELAHLCLVADVQAGVSPISGNPNHLRRMLDNLVGNALKFTPAGGRVCLSLRQVDSQVIVDVSDTGIGIPSDQLERIFERFYQVNGSSKRRYGGTGLGLALVKEIAEAHGGKVMVESVPDVGSCFQVSLPIHTNQQIALPAPDR